jgi:hypothetical protein
MPNDPKECRMQARCCADLAFTALHLKLESTSPLSQSPGSNWHLSLKVPRHFSMPWMRSRLTSFAILKPPECKVIPLDMASCRLCVPKT